MFEVGDKVLVKLPVGITVKGMVVKIRSKLDSWAGYIEQYKIEFETSGESDYYEADDLILEG